MKTPISYYTLRGNHPKKTLVFLHGFLEDSTVWKTLSEALSNTYKTISIDLLGHGKTPTIAPIHTMEMMAEEVKTVLDNENISKCTLVGHSMGGYVALAFAELFPKYIDGLVLLNSTPLPDSEEKKANRDRVLKVIEKEKELFVRTAITNLFSEENRSIMTTALQQLIRIGIATPNEGIAAASLGMKERPDRTSVLQYLSAKKLFILGKEDALIPYQKMIALGESTGMQSAVLEGGHLVYIENEAATIEVLRNFMKQI
jgi:alpha/beta hydrolase family protein|nr:alpha/beta fold hydrolase [uncultured Capnocytophaga sp.]